MCICGQGWESLEQGTPNKLHQFSIRELLYLQNQNIPNIAKIYIKFLCFENY